MGKSKRALSTEQIHHPYRAPEGWAAIPVGVYKASTVLFKNTADLHTPRPRDGLSYRYGLHGTPTSYTLAARIASLEGAEHCLLAPSGLAAVTLVSLGLLRPGDEVLVPDNVYGQNRYLSESFLPQFGITHRFYDPLDAAGFAELLGPQTKLVWLEAAGSITLEFPDLVGLLQACKSHGVISALDNTWGSGVAFNPFEIAPGLGVDISMQALTKYASGGADILMGSVCTRDRALHERLNYAHEHLGYGLGQNDVELVLRGLPTLELRYRAQDATTRALAQWMAARPEVARVLHPALPGSPGHEFWAQTSSAGAACLFSAVFMPEYSAAQVDAFVDALQLFGIGYSWAGPMSLAVPYDMSRSRALDLPYQAGVIVRFAIGLEAEADLRADIEQALSVLRA
ncbi:PLP-dependent transferase [Paucibacter sp. XJ19-41]|uniref:PLP-dependent transferase n=1 Tax=Paucibacter sp. XJ19-41 TaxID=2927824 RepID=UPI00234AA633|nr:PLP-dependent transferase [Paucibacter sp. XJ19-41]MDC6169674.1 PLP-dependent transferase [Paucibacter sp. XJ19-41]